MPSPNPENPTWYCFHSCLTHVGRQHREHNYQREDTQLNCGLLISKSWFTCSHTSGPLYLPRVCGSFLSHLDVNSAHPFRSPPQSWCLQGALAAVPMHNAPLCSFRLLGFLTARTTVSAINRLKQVFISCILVFISCILSVSTTVWDHKDSHLTLCAALPPALRRERNR